MTEHAEEIDGGGAFHRGSLRHREEVEAVAPCAASAAFGQRERNRRGSAFKLIAEGRAGALRECRNHRGEFEGDTVDVEAFVIEQWTFRRDGSGGRVGCVLGREIQSGTPIKS